MFHEDGTFSLHNEIMVLAEEFCQEFVKKALRRLRLH